MSTVKNILVITYWSLDNALITTYTLPYVRIILKQLPKGSKVWLTTLSNKSFRESEDHLVLVNSLRAEGIESVDFEYRRFGISMILKSYSILSKLVSLCFRKKISYIHAWCTPGGAIGYLVSKMTGRALILDSFEPHAETMVENGTWKRGGLPFKLLFSLEKKQAKRARHIICAAPGMMGYTAIKYGIIRPEEFVKPACVDLALFKPGNTPQGDILDRNIICVYAGKFGGIYLAQETFEFFVAASSYWKGRFRVLLLTSHTETEITEFCNKAGFDRSNISAHFVTHHEVPRYLASADFAICPVKPIPTKKFCSPIKDGEYWACGLPVVITENISTDSEIIKDHSAGYVLRNLNRNEYLNAAMAIDNILQDPGHKQRIREIAEKYRHFSIAENIYRSIYA